jgi:hypothetical protein
MAMIMSMAMTTVFARSVRANAGSWMLRRPVRRRPGCLRSVQLRVAIIAAADDHYTWAFYA